MGERQAERIGPGVARPRDRGSRRDRAVGAGFERRLAHRLAGLALLGDDVDDAGHGVRAVERRLRPAQNLDAVDVERGEIAEIEEPSVAATLPIGTPSISTSDWPGPRRAGALRSSSPGPAVCVTSTPATSRKTSVMPCGPHWATCEPGMTVTEEPVELTGSAMRSAVTVTSGIAEARPRERRKQKRWRLTIQRDCAAERL